jgi:flagellar motility protein MotE (MotC chaperone)
MAGQIESQMEPGNIGMGQKVLYFAVIPLIFTAMLAGAGAVVIQQGKGKSFTDTVLQVGKVAASGTKTAVDSMTKGKKSDAAGNSGSSSGANASSNGGSSSEKQPAVATDDAQSSVNGPGAAANNSGSNGTSGANAGGQQSGTQTGASAAMTQTAAGTAMNSAAAGQSSGSAEFKQKLDAVAAEYSKIAPKQAGAIIATMSPQDAAFTVLGMKPQQRVAILATMDPKKAAEITKSLKNIPPDSPDNADRIQSQLSALPDTQVQLPANDEFLKTFNQIPAHSAALIITELMKTDPKKALKIVSGMETATRAAMLSDLVTAVKTNPDGVQAATSISNSLTR